MANIYDQIDWIVPGESVKSSIANRPLKKLVDILDNNENPSLSSVQGTNIDITLVDDGVSSGDFVYYDSTAGVFKQALGGTNDKVQGCYVLDESSNHTLVFGGLLDIGTYIKDETYYLSDVTAGTLTNVWYNGAIEIGVAISTTELLMSSIKDLSKLVDEFQGTPDDSHYPSEKLVKDNFDLLSTPQNGEEYIVSPVLNGSPDLSFSSTGARKYPDGTIVVKTDIENYIEMTNGVVIDKYQVSFNSYPVFDSTETWIRFLTSHTDGYVYAGTNPNGLIYRSNKTEVYK